MEPALDLERFASLSAELDAGVSRDELCAREGISVDDWARAQEVWLSRLADETKQKRFALTNKYNATFVARRRAITHPAAVKHARPAPPAPKSAPEEPPPLAPPPVQVPSYAARSELASPPPYAASDALPHGLVAPFDATPLAPEPSPLETAPIPFVSPDAKPRKGATVAMPAFTDVAGGAPLPFKAPPPGPPPPAPPAPDPPPRPADPGDGSGTVTGTSPIARSKPVTPFMPAGQRPVSPSRVRESTVAVAIPPGAQGAAPLPFQASGAVPPAPPPPPQAAPPKPVPIKVPDATPGPDATVYGAVSPFAKGAPLPFQPSKPAEPRAPSPAPQGALPFQAKPSAAPPRPPPASGASRPSPSVVTSGQRLTIEQFASLTAEIAVNPRGAAQIRARYGLDEAAHAAEAEAYNRRFGADKALYDRYIELFQSYRDYVARAQR